MNQYLDEPVKRDLWTHVKAVHQMEMNKKSLESVFVVQTDSRDTGESPRSPEPSVHKEGDVKPMVTILRDQNIVSFTINPVGVYCSFFD